VGHQAWAGLATAGGPEELPARLEAAAGVPAWAADLARVELARSRAAEARLPRARPEHTAPNPGLQLVEAGWRGLAGLAGQEGEAAEAPPPRPGRAWVAAWPAPESGELRLEELDDAALLALKLVVEGLTPRQAAAQTQADLGVFSGALQRAAQRGLVLRPASALVRPAGEFPELEQGSRFREARVFTLQWHITQACELHCRHCYDRSARRAVSLEQGLAVLDEVYDFCQERHVLGQVSFSGGNPLLHPDFEELYHQALRRGLAVGILANPCRAEVLDGLLARGRPAFFQVSLEGLAEHNDYMRGPGHFARTLEFLELLRERGVYSMVMLTLTRDNLDQVLPLGERLRGLCGEFNFNRLALFGEGAALAMPRPEDYRAFVRDYLAAARENPVLRLKDSLFNLALAEQGRPPVGGCTGFGCGAAFNFLAALPDGEVHACRKLPSYLGNLHRTPLGGLYDSPAAQAFRRRSAACAGCQLRAVCGGCLAVTAGVGLDPATERDPFCWAEP
jgi:selenobiotic family peptide radical SAM maturase